MRSRRRSAQSIDYRYYSLGRLHGATPSQAPELVRDFLRGRIKRHVLSLSGNAEDIPSRVILGCAKTLPIVGRSRPHCLAGAAASLSWCSTVFRAQPSPGQSDKGEWAYLGWFELAAPKMAVQARLLLKPRSLSLSTNLHVMCLKFGLLHHR